MAALQKFIRNLKRKDNSIEVPKYINLKRNNRKRLSLSVTADSPFVAIRAHHLTVDHQKPLLELVMCNAVLHEMFIQWTEKELSVENVQVYELIQSYKRAMNNPQRRETIASYIKKSYLSQGAEFDLNIRDETRYSTIRDIEMSIFDDILFQQLEIEVEATMNDTLNRFCMSDNFQHYTNHGSFIINRRANADSLN